MNEYAVEYSVRLRTFVKANTILDASKLIQDALWKKYKHDGKILSVVPAELLAEEEEKK